MKLDFKKFTIEKIVLETRFPNGFLYWDNCGKIWNNITEKWTALQMLTVDPNNAVFKIEHEGIEINFSQQNIVLTQDYPTESLKLFKELAKEGIPIIAEHMKLKTFTRIGNRILYIYKTDSIEAAGEILIESGLFHLPENKIKIFGNKIEEPNIRFVINNDDMGYIINIKTFSRKVNIPIPKPLKIDDSRLVKNGILLDVDYFTLKSVDLSIIDFDLFLSSAKKNLDEKLSNFLAGE